MEGRNVVVEVEVRGGVRVSNLDSFRVLRSLGVVDGREVRLHTRQPRTGSPSISAKIESSRLKGWEVGDG